MFNIFDWNPSIHLERKKNIHKIESIREGFANNSLVFRFNQRLKEAHRHAIPKYHHFSGSQLFCVTGNDSNTFNMNDSNQSLEIQIFRLR